MINLFIIAQKEREKNKRGKKEGREEGKRRKEEIRLKM